MDKRMTNAGFAPKNILHAGILCVVVTLLMLSDCHALLGDRAYDLKYYGLAIFLSLCLLGLVMEGATRFALVSGFIALSLLLSSIPFQTSSFSAVQSVLLYTAVFLVACHGGGLIRSRREQLALGCFATLLIAILLFVSRESAIAQFRLYAAIGRPRLKGCFSNPNSLGGISSITAILIMSTLLSRDASRAERRAGGVFFALDLSFLLLSGSRTSMLVVAGFVAMFCIAEWSGRAKGSLSPLIMLVASGVLVVIALLSSDYLASDVPFQLRMSTLRMLGERNQQALVGIGYVSSAGISQLTAVAGGATDMLYVSLPYRVGILGCVAYALLVVAASERGLACPGIGRSVSFAIIAALVLQGMGESYLSSVMSYVSCMDWLLLSSTTTLFAHGA